MKYSGTRRLSWLYHLSVGECSAVKGIKMKGAYLFIPLFCPLVYWHISLLSATLVLADPAVPTLPPPILNISEPGPCNSPAGEVKMNHLRRPYTVTVTTHQLIVLLAFNDSQQHTYRHVCVCVGVCMCVLLGVRLYHWCISIKIE